MRTPFGDLLTGLITERGFTSAHAYATQVGLSPSYIYKILDGKCPPPPKHLAAMADLLKLKGKDRYRFVLQAALAHVPDQMSTLLAGLHRSVPVNGHDLQGGVEAFLGIAQRNPPAQRRRYRKHRPRRHGSD